MLEIVQGSAGRNFALADFALQFADARLQSNPAAGLHLLDFPVEMRQIFHGNLNFMGEFFPLAKQERNPAHGERSLHQCPVQLALHSLARLLVAQRDGFQLFGQLQRLLVRRLDAVEHDADFVATLGVCRSPLFHVPQIHNIIQILDAFFEIFGEFENGKLHHGGTADGLLHAEFAAFHAAGQVDFAFARQQRHRPHLAQVHANRVVRIDRLFLRLLRMEKVRLGSIGIEEFSCLFVEIDAQWAFG